MDTAADLEWRCAQRTALVGLRLVLDRYRTAAASLSTMGVTYQSIDDNIEIAWAGFTAHMDTTQYLSDAEKMANLVNLLCCRAGAEAIAANVKAVAAAMVNLRKLDEAFIGAGKWTVAEAWAYLDRVNDFLQGERENEIAMGRAGYQRGQ